MNVDIMSAVTPTGEDGSGIYQKSLRVNGVAVDIIRANFAGQGKMEQSMREYIQFHKNYVASKKSSRKIFFFYDLTRLSAADVNIQLIKEFTQCHRANGVQYADCLAGTFVLLRPNAVLLARVITSALSVLYTPVRPLSISTDPERAVDFLKEAIDASDSNIRNEIESS